MLSTVSQKHQYRETRTYERIFYHILVSDERVSVLTPVDSLMPSGVTELACGAVLEYWVRIYILDKEVRSYFKCVPCSEMRLE